MQLKEILNSPSKTFAFFLASFCFGIMFGALTKDFSQLLFLIVLAVILLSTSIVKTKRQRVISIALFLFVFGMFRYGQSEIPKGVTSLKDVSQQATRVSGVVSSEVEKQVGSKRVVLEQVKIADKSVHGKLLVHLPLQTKVSYADKLVFNCSLKNPEPFNGFSYDKYLESKGVLSVCYFPNYVDVVSGEQFSIIGTIFKIKESANRRLSKIITEPHATFLSGLIFGGSSGLSSELKNDFSRTGTSHILAASGFNVSLFSFVFLGWIIQTRLGRKKGIYLTAFLLLGYVVMAGMGPAVVRATLLAFVILTGALVGRRASSINALLFTGSLILLANPRLLLDDVGFQLSFVATAAIMFLVPVWREKFLFIPEAFALREAFVGSLAAITATLPIVVYHFGSISLIAPLVNFLILPLVPYLIALTIIAFATSVISIQAATLFALPAWGLSFVILQIIRLSSLLPLSQVVLENNKEIGLTLAALLLLIFYSVYGKARHFHIRQLV